MRYLALVFLEPTHVVFHWPEALLVGDAEVLVQLRHERDRLHAGPFEQVHGSRVPPEAFGEFVQSLGDLGQDLGGRLEFAGGGMQVHAHSLQGGPRLFALPGILIRGLREAAHQALHDRDVLAHGLRGKPELPDLLGGQAGAQLGVLHPRAIFPQALGRLKRRNTEASQCGRARHDAHAERPHRGKQGADGAFRPLNGILDELANAISEGLDGLGLFFQRLLNFLGGSGFARRLLFDGDHLFVGARDRIDGRRLFGVSLEALVPLRDEPLDAALAVSFGLLFERGDEPLDRGPGLVGDADDLAVRRFRFLFEAVETGVGLVDNGSYRVFGFEDYAFRLIAHLCCLDGHRRAGQPVSP